MAASSRTADFTHQVAALIPAEVRMISGCHSEQQSVDVSDASAVAQLPDPAGRAGGACTSILLDILYTKKNQKVTFQQLLLDLRQSLSSKGLEQIPQLTSSRPLELQETPFSLVGGQGICRALLVGINYHGQKGELRGCQNDIFNVKQYIMKEAGYLEHNILVLVEDGRHHYPNRSSIVTALKQLVVQSQPGDSVYFHFSGHGGLLNADWNPLKSNRKEYDETIYPLDHERSGHIRDFSLFNHFVKPMSAGVTVTCVLDCCHSGAVLDLPFSYKATSAGLIRAQRNMSSLTNLAFLYLLAGGILPPGFDDVAANIQDVTGSDLDEYFGSVGEPDQDMPEGTVANEGVEQLDHNAVGGPFDNGLNGNGDGSDVFDGGQPTIGGQTDVWDGGDRVHPSDFQDTGVDQGIGDVEGDAPELDCSCLGDVLDTLLED